MFFEEISRRLSSALVIMFIFSFALSSFYLFTILMSIVLFFMLREWFSLVKLFSQKLIGSILISTSVMIIIYTRSIDYKPVLLFFISVWCNDTFAMIIGKNISGPKIAPYISPNKTWSGFIGGVLISSVLVVYSAKMLDYKTLYLNSDYAWFCYAVVCAILAFFSDLFISFFKRLAKVKDTGNIIPGHGGALDRFDSIIFTSFILLVYCL